MKTKYDRYDSDGDVSLKALDQSPGDYEEFYDEVYSDYDYGDSYENSAAIFQHGNRGTYEARKQGVIDHGYPYEGSRGTQQRQKVLKGRFDFDQEYF